MANGLKALKPTKLRGGKKKKKKAKRKSVY